MPRNLSPAMLAQVAANQLRPALFLEIEFLTETVLLWNGFGPMVAPGPATNASSSFPYGQSFIGMGWMGEIRSVPQVADVVAQNITLVLTGIPSELLTDAINAVRQNSIATLWLGCLDGGNNVIGDPVQIFQGALDVPTVTEGAETSTISITCENPLIDLNRAPSRRFTDVDQQFDFPGDMGFFQVQLLQDYNFTWPAPIGSNNGDTTPPPDFLTIEPGQSGPVVIAVGGSVQLIATNTWNDGSQHIVAGPGSPGNYSLITWSTDPSIATVTGPGVYSPASGLVTGVAPGMCVVSMMFVQGGYIGSGTNKPSNPVTASVTIIVTEA